MLCEHFNPNREKAFLRLNSQWRAFYYGENHVALLIRKENCKKTRSDPAMEGSGLSCVKTMTEDAEFDDFHENYSLGAILGRGGFGTVYAAVRNSDGLAVAVKHVLRNRVQSWGKVSNH